MQLRRGEIEKPWGVPAIQAGSAHTDEQICSDMTSPRLKCIKLVSQSRFVKVFIPAVWSQVTQAGTEKMPPVLAFSALGSPPALSQQHCILK